MFNKIFNRRAVIRKKVQIIVIILVCNYYFFNVIFEDYGIKDIISENNLEIEKYAVIHKIQSLNFIILSEYIILESTITRISIPLKDNSNKKFLAILFKQLYSHTRSQFVQKRNVIMWSYN